MNFEKLQSLDLRDVQHTNDNRFGENLGYNYKNIPIHCVMGIHEAAFSLVESLNLKKDSQILILGAGSGAFDQRLLDNGFSNITAVEFIKDVYKISGTKLFDLDLSQDFSHLGQYDLVIAIEIIEHLENQFHFIREIKKLLTSTGHLILSTPNAESSFARIKYFIVGELQFFHEDLYLSGHISPIFRHVLDFNLSQSGLKIIKVLGNGNLWKRLIFLKYKNIFMIFFCFLLYLISFLELRKDKEHNQNINIFLIGHSN